MSNQKLEKVREIIIKSVPEIVDGYTVQSIGAAYEIYDPIPGSPGCFWAKVRKGRPIRLSDVLVAIQKTPKSSKLVIDDYGVFWDFNNLQNSTLQEKPFFWNLLDDDLSHQSEETLDFLLSILE